MERTFVSFNINHCVRVRLTDFGRKIHRQQFRKLNSSLPLESELKYMPPSEDENGWSEWQMWILMMRFGEHMGMGGDIPFETTIEMLQQKAD